MKRSKSRVRNRRGRKTQKRRQSRVYRGKTSTYKKRSRKKSRCNRKSSKKSCKRKIRGKKRCSWVKRKSNNKHSSGHKAYCKKMKGGCCTKETVLINGKYYNIIETINIDLSNLQAHNAHTLFLPTSASSSSSEAPHKLSIAALSSSVRSDF